LQRAARSRAVQVAPEGWLPPRARGSA
jgi:hypothetical protein